MDPVTIGIVVVVVAAFALSRTPSNVSPAVEQAAVAQQDGALPPAAGPEPSNVKSVAPAIFGGAHKAGADFRNRLDGVINNTLVTAKQRATAITGGSDPAFVTAGSAKAARGFVQRGLTTTADAAGKVVQTSWQYSPLGVLSGTKTGQAATNVVVGGAQQTGAAVIAAGGSVAQATAQAATNVASSAQNAAASADQSAANFINNNNPFR